MKKKVLVTIFFALLVFFCGCGAENTQKNNHTADDITALPKEEPEKTEQWISATGQGDPVKEEALLNNRERIKEEMAALENMDWTNLELYADAETSLLNSNVLRNYGYLAYDEEGTIYFADRNIGGIFVSDRNGKNRRQLTPDSGKNLQIAGEWLYYLSTGKKGIKRIYLETGEVEELWKQECESFILWKDKLYINGFDGFYVAEPDGKNEVLLHEQSLMLHRLQLAGDGLWLGNAFNGEDYAFMLEGHLLSYKESGNVLHYIEEEAQDTLVAGSWLCFSKSRSGKRVVWDLRTKTITELNLYDDSCVSDGTSLYISSSHGDSPNVFYRWNGGEAEELFQMETDMYVHNKYLTPDRLYWMQADSTDGWLWEFWYYDMKTGEIGQIY